MAHWATPSYVVVGCDKAAELCTPIPHRKSMNGYLQCSFTMVGENIFLNKPGEDLSDSLKSSHAKITRYTITYSTVWTRVVRRLFKRYFTVPIPAL